MLGIDAAIVNEQGEELGANKGGLFVIRKPWPGMLRGVYGNRERFISNYWGRVKDPTTGDALLLLRGRRTPRSGRLLLDPGPHRRRHQGLRSPAGNDGSRERARVAPPVAEAAVVGVPHEIKGNAICAFVTLKPASGSSRTTRHQPGRCAPQAN
jgi:acetyl-CoA synthetase